MQRRNLVVEGIAPLVETAQALRQRFLDKFAVDRLALGGACRRTHLFEQIEQTPRIAVGQPDQAFARRRVKFEVGQRTLAGAVEQGTHLGLVERFEHIDRSPRQQRRIDLEGRVFGRCADEGEQARFDERQKAVLLRLVEAVDFIDEEDGALALRPPHLGLGHCLAHFLDAGKHRRERDELATELRRHHARQRRLADTGRPPQDHRMRLAGGKSQAQRLARPEQMLLADHLVRRLRAQLLGERGGTVDFVGGKQIAQADSPRSIQAAGPTISSLGK